MVDEVEKMIKVTTNNKRDYKGNHIINKERTEQDKNMVLEDEGPTPKRMKVDEVYNNGMDDGGHNPKSGSSHGCVLPDDVMPTDSKHDDGMMDEMRDGMSKKNGMVDDNKYEGGQNPNVRQSQRNGMDVIMESGGGGGCSRRRRVA